jgi:hypothetical protein
MHQLSLLRAELSSYAYLISGLLSVDRSQPRITYQAMHFASATESVALAALAQDEA